MRKILLAAVASLVITSTYAATLFGFSADETADVWFPFPAVNTISGLTVSDMNQVGIKDKNWGLGGCSIIDIGGDPSSGDNYMGFTVTPDSGNLTTIEAFDMNIGGRNIGDYNIWLYKKSAGDADFVLVSTNHIYQAVNSTKAQYSFTNEVFQFDGPTELRIAWGTPGGNYYGTGFMNFPDGTNLNADLAVEFFGSNGPATEAPSSVSNVVAEAAGVGIISVTYNDVLGEEGFIIQRGPDALSLVAVATNSPNVLEYLDTGLADTTTYFYSVVAYNSIGSSTNNGVDSATTPTPTAPPAVSNLTATASGIGVVDIAYTHDAPVSGLAEGFIIERGLDALSLAPIATNGIGVLTYSDTTVADGTEYFYSVIAYNNVGSSIGNPVVSVTSLTPSTIGSIFSDDFDQADGTALTNLNWTYVDLGVGDNPVPRTAPADILICSNNMLYAEITPLETDSPVVYNKVQIGLYPMDGGERLSAIVSDGRFASTEFDLVEVHRNNGYKYSINHEPKIVLSSTTAIADPDGLTDNIHTKMTVRPTSMTQLLRVNGREKDGLTTQTRNLDDYVEGDLPLRIRIEYHSHGKAVFTSGDRLLGILDTTDQWEVIYPYIWIGLFNGDGTELTEGSSFFDNYDVSVGLTPTNAPAAVSGVTALNNGGQVTVTWTDNATNEVAYRIDLWNTTDNTTNLINNILDANTESFVDSTVLDPLKAYSYIVTPYNVAGDGPNGAGAVVNDVYVGWAGTYGLSGAKTSDFDGDGMTDWQEYSIMGDPTNSADRGMMDVTLSGSTYTYTYAVRNDNTNVAVSLVGYPDLRTKTPVQTVTPSLDGTSGDYDILTSSFDVSGYDDYFVTIQIQD